MGALQKWEGFGSLPWGQMLMGHIGCGPYWGDLFLGDLLLQFLHLGRQTVDLTIA